MGQPLTRIVAAALACAALATQAVATEAKAAAPLGGINIGGIYPGEARAQIDQEIATARALHAKVIRVELPWSSFEPTARGQIDPSTVAAADHLFGDAAAAGIKVIALLDSTPCWASSAPASVLAGCNGDQRTAANAWPPQQPSDFGAFAGLIAARYHEYLVAIEVWNEPDQANQDYLAGSEKPRHYAELLKAAYPAVKAAAPGINVLAGSLVGSNGAFMRALYKQGVKGYYDGVSVHFYNLVLGSARRFREVQIENGDHKPLWLDEFGWASCWPKRRVEQEQGCVTQAVQAQNVTNSFRELWKTPYIAALLTYGVRDVPGEEFGVLSASGNRKPSFYALSKALQSPLGPPSPVTLKLRVKNGRVIASGSGPVGDYMKIEVFLHGILRWKPFFTLNRFNGYSIPLPKALGTHGLTVRVYQYWMGAGHDAQRSI